MQLDSLARPVKPSGRCKGETNFRGTVSWGLVAGSLC